MNPTVSLVHPGPAAPAVTWALGHLAGALSAAGAAVRRGGRVSDVTGGRTVVVSESGEPAARAILSAARVTVPKVPEALALVEGAVSGHPVLLATGSDARGLVYALTELADRVACTRDPVAALSVPRPVVQQPANRVRSVARYFTSEVEDPAWYHDRAFWDGYLTMLVTERFNRFSLSFGLGYNFPRHVSDAYLYFAYPYLLSVPGYDVRVPGLADGERGRNLASLQAIGEMTVSRGLDFQLALWTHACEWVDSPDAHHVVTGLTPENHAAYCSDAVRQLLDVCPAISGLTFRIHGESGIPEGSFDFWRTVFAGVSACGRRVEIDMHAKGMDPKMLDVALATGLPVKVSAKYWAEHTGLPYHQASIRDQERPKSGRDRDFMAFSGGSRRFLRYSYGDLLREDRRYGAIYRVWPGTQRHLLWGDPAMAAGYGRWASFCGCDGLELMEPLTFKGRMGSGLQGGREGYADPALRSEGGDWRKFAYTYRLLGRLLYDPGQDPEAWRRFLRARFGDAAGPVEEALALAGRILPLITMAHHPSASNNRYWPEVYTNMPIVDPGRPHPYTDTADPKCFGTVSPLDPAMFSSIEDFATETLTGAPSGRYSPLEVAAWLEGFGKGAESALARAETQARDARAPDFRRVAVDVSIQAGIGRFFAGKLRAGVAHALCRRGGDIGHLQAALAFYRGARGAWARLSGAASVYARDLTYGREPFLRGHWADRLPAIDDDLSDMAALLASTGAKEDPQAAAPLPASTRLAVACDHEPPRAFAPGRDLDLTLSVRDGGPASVRLHYRHVNQAETWETVAAAAEGSVFTATIPAACTESPYALQYWFELRGGGLVTFWPGLDADLSNQPYYVVRRKVRTGAPSQAAAGGRPQEEDRL